MTYVVCNFPLTVAWPFVLLLLPVDLQWMHEVHLINVVRAWLLVFSRHDDVGDVLVDVFFVVLLKNKKELFQLKKEKVKQK